MSNQKAKRSKKNKKDVNWIESQGEDWSKMFQNGQTTGFGEKLYQLQVKLSPELSVIETNCFCAERGSQ